jgi:hypothetical protein
MEDVELDFGHAKQVNSGGQKWIINWLCAQGVEHIDSVCVV